MNKMIYIKEIQRCFEIGKRNNNEDYLYPLNNDISLNNNLFIVCDGMGGHECGEVASKIVVDTISNYWNNSYEPNSIQKLRNAISKSVENMNLYANENNKGFKMGTTLTMIDIEKNTIFAAHVGDSRIYHIRPNKGILYQSKDHSYVQTLVDQGLITLEEARVHPRSNIITQVIAQGTPIDSTPDVMEITDIQSGDYFFLCSDGIIESLSDAALVEIISSDISDDKKMRAIVTICAKNSRDNFTSFLIQIE